MTNSKHDLVVLGGGPGGYVAAIRAAQLGLNVGCVDENKLLGGTCLRVGCIPSKSLLETSHRYHEFRHDMEVHGIRVRGVELDVAAMMRRKDDIVRTLAQGVESLFKRHNVTRYVGRGRLDGPGRVVVEAEAGSSLLEAANILIATGSRPANLPGVELDAERVGTSTEALAYGEIPKRMVVIGGGYIGLELGSVWARLGSKVTVLEALDRIMPGSDGELARQAQSIFEKQGLEFRLGARVKRAYAERNRCKVELEGADPVEAERVLVAIGRVPNTEGLGLDTVGVACDQRGHIQIDDAFATNVPGIFAIGDCVRGPKLAHKASDEGLACVERLVTGYGHVDYGVIPAVCYTHPEVASVGLSEEELKQAGRAYRRGVGHFRASGRARTLGDVQGWAKVLADAETDRILGVHIIGPRAGDLIAEAAAAMAFAASSEDLARVCHAHPTLSETLREAAAAIAGGAAHG